jgi:hypothetical protein
MLFENINQYQKAKQMLLSNGRDVKLVFNTLKKDNEFSNLSEGEILIALNSLNEGLGDSIANFLGSAFGGDISKIKTVLTQMKEQELKFNREEYQIYEEFYRTLQEEKALEKDTKNPNYQGLTKDIMNHRNSLNMRMKELNKMHEEIFDILEQKIKDLTGDNKRKKKYFNAQRATDVLETRNDRYEKIKAITAKSKSRSQDLHQFFGVSVEDAKREAEEAKTKAEKAVDKLDNTPPTTPSNISFTEDPEKSFSEELEKIRGSVGGYFSKRKDIENLKKSIDDEIHKPEFNNYSGQKQKDIYKIYLECENLLDALAKEEMKIK